MIDVIQSRSAICSRVQDALNVRVVVPIHSGSSPLSTHLPLLLHLQWAVIVGGFQAVHPVVAGDNLLRSLDHRRSDSSKESRTCTLSKHGPGKGHDLVVSPGRVGRRHCRRVGRCCGHFQLGLQQKKWVTTKPGIAKAPSGAVPKTSGRD